MKKIAIITGASSGLGKEFTKQIANLKLYDELWIIARRKDNLVELANQINSSQNFNCIRPVSLDLSKESDLYSLQSMIKKEDEALRKIESCIGIGLLINNAGYGTYGPFYDTNIQKETQMIDVNCKALTFLASIVLPYLDSSSVIINTSSLAAFMPLGNFAVYAASKAYVLSFSVALAAELKERGVKVCALCPGSVSTEFANVASSGERKEVLGGICVESVVRDCIKKAFKGKKIVLYRPKWKITAFFSRFVGRYFVASYTYKHQKRPYKKEVQDDELAELNNMFK